MAGWKLYDFTCKACSYVWEDLTKERASICPKCGEPNEPQLSLPRANTFNLLSKEERKEKLVKRSLDHTRKMKKGM